MQHSNLISGRSRGCLECRKLRIAASKRTHGASNTPEYRLWLGIKERCHNPRNFSYPTYGGRGISMHEAWQHDFGAFLVHIGPRPSSLHSIDRINNDMGYEPGNVRWATRAEQSRNTSRNRVVSVGGQSMILSDAAKLLGIKDSTAWMRLRRNGTLELRHGHN